MKASWEHFSHEADMGLRGSGDTLAQAFEQVALAMTATITSLERVVPRSCVDIECEGTDPEILLVDWLNALIYEMGTRRMLFSQFQVGIDGRRLVARACGEAVQVTKHSPAVEVKGATFTALKVAQLRNGGWVAQCVVDV